MTHHYQNPVAIRFGAGSIAELPDVLAGCGDCEMVIAVGGGSTIDTAKALMVGTASGRFDELIALLAKSAPFKPPYVKALIAVPTTAGTGSEVTPWATIWDRAAGKKHSLHLPETWPEAAIVDPDLMLTLPNS